ncbi:MAG: hypothetical protein QE271_13065 [Bacteriovoracaceae bacterium]|nr:hypothetical protein [Bacteriovoracaceae bacterium]
MFKFKNFFNLPSLVVLFFGGLISPLWATQHFTCFPDDVTSSDRVIISLKNSATGTLFLSSGIEDDGSHENSGVMELKNVNAENYVTMWRANNSLSEFTVFIDRNFIGVPSDNASVTLVMKNKDKQITQYLSCYSRIFE